MEELSLLHWTLFAGVVFLAGLVHGTLGLGFPVVATPLLALFVDVRSAILITLLPTATVNVASIFKGGKWGESIGHYWPLGVYSLIGSTFGTWLIVVHDPAPFKLALALLIFVYLGSGWLSGLRMPWVSAHQGWSMLVFGLAAGVAAGSTNVMVPILIIFALEVGLKSNAMVQVFNMCFLAGKLMQMVVFASAGLFHLQLAAYTTPLAVVALIALLLGMSVRSKIPSDQFRTIIKGVLFVLAVLLLWQFFRGV